MFNHMTPSSSTSTSASSNIRTTSCCISAIIRRILCFNHLTSSARALDRCLMYEERVITDKSAASCNNNNDNPPGIVAKLMGLDSLPIFEQSPSLDSRRKSRSMKNSSNSRQKIIPIYEEFEDENFFILSFEKGCDYQRRRRRKSRKTTKIMRRESLHDVDKENRGINVADNYGLLKGENEIRRVKNSRHGRDVKDVENELRDDRIGDDLENLSPNSVLDDVLCADDEESSSDCSSSGIISRLRNSKIRTLSEEIEDAHARSREEEEKAIHVSSEGKHHKCDEVGKLASSDMVKSSWIKDEMLNLFKEIIGRDLSLEILDQLISEEVVRNFD